MRIRFRLLSHVLWTLALVPALQAQIESNLATKTDLIDVYEKNSTKPEMVTIFDFTTPSRGVFEGMAYLTGKTRGNFIGANQGNTSTFQGVFQPAILGKDYGMVFGYKYVSSKTPSNPSPATALGTSNIEIRMWKWPQTQTSLSDVNGEVVGVPYQFKQDGTQTMVVFGTDDATTIRKITHVRFSITSGSITRTMDLPCPTLIFDSAHTADSESTRKAADPTYRNFSRAMADSTIKYDPWSEANLTNTATPSLGNGSNQNTIIGNFFYTFDYLSWIFGSKEVRNGNSSGWVAAPPSTARYGTSSGYAVAATTDTVKPADTSAAVNGTGWNNGLPVLTRYQGIKYTATNVLLNNDGKVNWIYRFLAPVYPGGATDDGDTAEELGTSSSTATIPANQSDPTSTKLKYLRKFTSAQLALNTTSLQLMGPSRWTPTTNNTMDLFDFGNKNAYDPRSPMPWSYTLANTYYRAAVERDPTIFDPINTTCPGKTFVVLFPIHGMNDSLTASLDQGAANAFQDYFHAGNSGLGGGSISALPSETATVPGTQGFNTGILASLAAFGTRTLNNSTYWGAPWQINPSTTRSSTNPGIQTMAVSLGIPGSYKLASDNNGRNPHEAYLRIAQWADPTRTSPGYGQWARANGGNDDSSVVDGGLVHYYPSSDPTELEKNIKDLLGYIVQGSAALSAPATPSTGARTSNQAYFGTFITSRTPVWPGTLFSVGMDRKTVTSGATSVEVLTFYGAQGEDTRPAIYDALGNITGYGISDFDRHHLWSTWDIFANYLASELPSTRPVYTGNTLGGVVSWNNRTIWTTRPADGTKADFLSTNTSLVSDLVTAFSTPNLFAATVTDKTAEVQAFINYVRGKNPNDSTGVTNHLKIMGDIINSAPLAVELSRDRVSGSMLSQWDAFAGSTYQDIHARLLMVGTNFGQLHCFGEVAATATADVTRTANNVVTQVAFKGKVKAYATELWSFIPRETLETLYQVYANRDVIDTFKHRYIMDGDPVLYHVDVPPTGQLRGDTRVSGGSPNLSEDAMVIVGMRKGGRNYYAIQISSSDSSLSGITPTSPVLAWKLVPSNSSDTTIKKMGMSTPVPAFGIVSTSTEPNQPVLFLSGGYANREVNARYQAAGVITALEGLGKMVLALDPMTGLALPGAAFSRWDFSGNAEFGAIAGGVTPVTIFRSTDKVHRIYWGDFRGNVMAINGGISATAASNFRIDTAVIANWINTPRAIYKSSANAGVQRQRFTSRPAADRLSGNYPVPQSVTLNGIITQVRPVTVMVAIGAGDRNNPTDRDGTVTVGGLPVAALPSTTNNLYVFADRQDSANVPSRDSNGILDTELQVISDPAGVTTWATSYSDARVTPGSTTFLWNDKSGYFFTLRDGTLPTAFLGATHDKVLVSPLIKDTALFFSLFNISNANGVDCSSNAFTRTYRECDLIRPLGFDTQVQATQTVGDTNNLNRNLDNCSGLAFFFNSLSSQLTDAGDRVVQGGAVSSGTGSNWDKQVGANTPDIKQLKNTSDKSGFRLRAWRIVR